MSAWLDYSLADFLLFSPEAYWRLFELTNGAVWPLHFVILGVLVSMVAAAAFGWRYGGLATGLCLAICWALVAHLFFAKHYEQINWSIAWVTPVAWVQVCLLIVLAPRLQYTVISATLLFQSGLVVLALTYPLVGALADRPLAQSEIAGLAPDPTALLTIGMVTLARPDWRALALSALPIGWIIFSAATLLAMREPTAWVHLITLGMAARMLLRRT